MNWQRKQEFNQLQHEAAAVDRAASLSYLPALVPRMNKRRAQV